MKNRAKCKICQDIIESLHPSDIQRCRCGMITVSGGDAMISEVANGDYSNFLRVDDDGNEIAVKYKEQKSEEKHDEKVDNPQKPLSREELLKSLEYKIENWLDRPAHVIYSPASVSDLLEFMVTIVAILKRI